MNDNTRFVYRRAVTPDAVDAPFLRMAAEGLLPFAMPGYGAPTLDEWRGVVGAACNHGGVLLCCDDAQGRMLGCGLFTRQPHRVWQFDFTAFRAGFAVAVRQARGGFQWAFDHLDCTSIMGVCPLPNRHAWKLAEACGFRVLARLPEACFYARKQKYVDGVLVLCTRRSLASAENIANDNHNNTEDHMGFGGGVSTPDMPAPTPKAEVTKPVTEAATAARDAQRKRASKAAGLSSTILTGSPLENGVATSGKTLLGQ